jgi:hypothetical protein
VWLLTTQTQIAGANIIDNQVEWSPFEPLGPDQFSIIPFGTKAVVTWNLFGTGYEFQYLLLEAHGGNANIYALPTSHLPVGMGYVVIDNLSDIQAIIFYGGQFKFGARR